MASRANLLTNKLTTGAGGWVSINKDKFVATAKLGNTTTPAATVYVQYSPDGGTTIKTLATITLSGANANDMANIEIVPGSVRLYVQAISGTNAAVSGDVRW